MASTPSASALSAVLRCRGNIWTRNPPTKRPATSAYSLSGSPAERARSNQATAWEAFLQGDRVLVGRRLAVAYESPRWDGRVLREKHCRENNNLCHQKLSQSAGDARSAAPGVQNALVRQLVRRLTGRDKCSQIIQKIKHETGATHICKIVFGQETSEVPAGVLKVSLTSSCLAGKAGEKPSYVLPGWSTLRSTCVSLTALVSELMLQKLVELWRSCSSPDDAPQHQDTTDNVLKANRQIHRPTDLSSAKENSGQMIPKDRPD
ncbi:uncharacterized protein LOC121939069 [Plectropomus leopardus]|uniref:uncharacterized protein LOC121939069 n=1 Tax=Plectropomus leopardus TaxID=160734 RepID=UPI001C4D380F|nr:uncharacterized protein LOC121939069 [Plectropomus leopardus]